MKKAGRRTTVELDLKFSDLQIVQMHILHVTCKYLTYNIKNIINVYSNHIDMHYFCIKLSLSNVVWKNMVGGLGGLYSFVCTLLEGVSLLPVDHYHTTSP